jgi:hypothetical protein
MSARARTRATQRVAGGTERGPRTHDLNDVLCQRRDAVRVCAEVGAVRARVDAARDHVLGDGAEARNLGGGNEVVEHDPAVGAIEGDLFGGNRGERHGARGLRRGRARAEG